MPTTTNTHTLKVPESILKMADTMQVDPFDAELFQSPRAVPAVSKRKRPTSSSASATPASRSQSSTAAAPIIDVDAPLAESSAERKARVFVQTQLDRLRQEEQQRTESTDHSIAGGSYVSGKCPTLEVKSIFSDVISGGPSRQAIIQSFIACMHLIAIQAYNAEADERRGRKMARGIALDAHYLQLVQRADLFRTWRLTFFTSLLINISDSAREQRMREMSTDAEPNESIVTLHPLPMQKFLGYMLWVPIPRSPDDLAGKKNCYTCCTPLREGQSSCYKTVRLARTDRTGVPQQGEQQHTAYVDQSTTSAHSATRITPEIVGSSEADKHVHFQICSSCNDSTQMWLGMRDLFRSERNLAIVAVEKMVKQYASQNKRLTCAEFVEAYLRERDPPSIWNDVYKCFRMLVNSFGMFLRSACAESTARCMSGLFYDIFPDGDPRNNPFNKPVDPPSRATRVVKEMLSMSVEARLEHLHRLTDPDASEDIGAVWRALQSLPQ